MERAKQRWSVSSVNPPEPGRLIDGPTWSLRPEPNFNDWGRWRWDYQVLIEKYEYVSRADGGRVDWPIDAGAFVE